jgi:hypothetical protein
MRLLLLLLIVGSTACATAPNTAPYGIPDFAPDVLGTKPIRCSLDSECSPPCAPGETCARFETCYDSGCTERWACEGTPDDCRTNGCNDDDKECRPTGSAYVCADKSCAPRPTHFDCDGCWHCTTWSSTKGCCYEWHYMESL